MSRALVVAYALALILVVIGAELLAAALAGAAVLRVSGTTPLYDNDGTCAAPVLTARAAGDSCWMHFAWSGNSRAGEDSVHAAGGQLVGMSVPGLPPGFYTVRAWASDPGGAGCDTLVMVRVRAQPWRPRIF